DAISVWPTFRDNQIACNGYTRGTRTDLDAILDEIRYDDYIVLKGFSPGTGMCVYGIGKVVGMNTYNFPIPDGYDNQCIKLNWILRSVDDRYVNNFPSLVGAPYSEQLFKLNGSAIADISAWLNSIGIRV
ncbi:MAG: hypothetical protein OMM_14856, partial [Candidatus Magnetoglobus multicellularis str. Araruama]